MLVNERNYAALLRHFEKATDLVADLETTGLHPFSGHRLCGVALEAGGVSAYFPFRHKEGQNLSPDLLSPLLDLWVSGVPVTGHNLVRFDNQMIAMERPDLVNKLVLSDQIPSGDTMISAYLNDENELSYKLENLASCYRVVKFDPKAEEEKLVAELARRGWRNKDAKSHLWELPPEVVEPYACNDVTLTRGLKTYYDYVLQSQGLLEIEREMLNYARIAARMERVGLKIDRARLEEQRDRTAARRDRWLEEIRSTAGADANPNSPPQMCKWLGVSSTKAELLNRMEDPRAKLLQRYRKAVKAVGTYHEPILALLDENDILHPQYNLTRDSRDAGGTRSGRLSCSNPNFQALPDVDRDVDKIYGVKECVIPREDGRCFLAWDLERAEMWLGGSLCGEEAIFQAYVENLDLYDVMAEEIGITRKQSKTLFLGLQYGMGAPLLAYKLGCSVEEAKAWRSKFHSLYPKIREKMQALSDLAERYGYVKLWTGRRIHMTGKTVPFHAWNRCVQGGVAEIIRTAMARLENKLEALDSEMVLQIHDELVVECPLAAAKEVNHLVVTAIETFPDMKLPPRTSPRWGLSLGTLKEGLPNG